ncbi:hypothetical protein CBR_g32090 [Chara braunii]|uniref:Uncharacterized protein n=1 Tax=Chara braunii TaxID=69332 RepID=A0A388LGI1_CHABU|nr:hypothetical protein CBR_g32090 [Chara braunii]|eukprot:GBG81414.1 hypothetical protein CBR_g32090 [Chara braunii]
METEDILKGFADDSKEGNSAGGNNADCAEVLATICAQTAEMMGDGNETENDAGGSTCETKTVGEEKEEGDMGSRESMTGCIVKDENVVKTLAGEEYPYDINWVSGRVQPGIVGGAPCFAFKVEGTCVPFSAPPKNTWRNVTLVIVFDRLLRLNDGATTEVKGRYALDMWRVLEAQGEFRLNGFLYDNFDCGQAWVIGGNDATGSTTCHKSDARRDPRWGWVPCVIPIPCGRVRMMMRDAMGNVWSTHYVNGNFSFRHLDREVSEDEKKAMACTTHTAGCFFPPLWNPVESEVVEGKVFTGEDGSTYTHAGQEATYDRVCSQIWDHVTMRSDVLSAMDIGARVIPEGQLQQHMAPEKYGYRVNWVPGCLHPAVVDGNVTMAARLQSGHCLQLGWMHAGIVEHWQFLVVLTRVSIFNVNVKGHVLVVEHAKRCWEKIREEERQMVCAGYDSMADQGMWSMVEGSCTAQEHGDGQNRSMARIRRRHGCTTVLGWVAVVCPMTYEHGGDVTMRFIDPLGVSFHLTYSDGFLRDIRYLSEDGLPGSAQAGKRTEKRSKIFRLSAEVEGPCGSGRVGGCSAAQGDMGGPSDVAMSQSPGKKKKCTPGSPRGQTPADRKKVNPKVVPRTGDTAGARTQVPRRRRRPGMTTLTEIRKLQRSTDLCLAFRPFLRLVREVVERDIASGMGVRFQMTASKRNGPVDLQRRDVRKRRRGHDNAADRGAYTPVNLCKLQGTVARNRGMLVDGSKDELKSGAAEILVLSRMKDITQTPPKDFQDVPVIVADGVEYILLDQLVDFMKKSDDDRNVIHEALHEVTEFALQGHDLIEFVSAITEDNIISGRPLWEELLSAALERLGLASCDVERQREREEGWKKMDSGPRVCDCSRPFMSLQTLNSHRARACPAVADERTHGQEMSVIDDAGASSIGAVNLVSDESEDVGAPENVDGEGGIFEEQQPQPVESFDSSRKLAALIFSARGGVGMSQSDIDALLSLLTDPRFCTRDIAYRNSRECLTWAGSLADAAGWKELDLRCDDWPRDAHTILWHRDWRTTFLSMFHIALQKCETVSSLEVSPPGVENRPPKATEKRSREDGMSKVHLRTKKRITYKKDRMVEMIDLRASDDMHSAAQEEAEEEHDQSISEKSDGEENEATSDKGGDSETSDGHSRDTHDADDEDGRSSDDTAQDEGGDGAGKDDRSADGRGSSPSPGRTRRTREPESGGEGGAADAPSIDRQLVRHDNAVKKGKQNVLKMLLLHNDYVVTAQSDDISLM